MSARTITGRLAPAALDLIFPPICLGCQREERPGPLRLGLCLPCRGRLVPLTGRRCAACARRIAAAAAPPGYLCGACRGRPRSFDRLLAVWRYQPPLEEVIHGLKFGRLDFLGAHLAAELWHRLGGDLRQAEAVVPVPLHWRRQATRGYNQAERIARPLAGRLGLPLVHAIRRVRPTPPQARLARSRRRANLRGAFRARRAARALRGRRVLLIDDVTTTGATIGYAAASLRRSGAAAVTALAVARTPASHRPGPPVEDSIAAMR